VRSEKLKNKSWCFFFALLTAHLLTALLGQAATPPDLEEQTRAIAAELRCPVCQNLSVADSPSEMAQQMRALVQEKLKEGKSSEEIKNFFVSKYGDWVLLAPPARGFSLLLWVLPGVVAVLGVIFVLLWMRRWTKKREGPPAAEEARQDSEAQRGLFLEEQARLEAEVKELEFDFQAGKLSETDYNGLRRDFDAQQAALLKRLESMPARPRSAGGRAPEKKTAALAARPLRRWPLVAGGIFLLLFGLALGVLLTQSIRPRGSAQDSITGDFLTGTQSMGGPDALLAQGRAAFEQRNLAQAIELFKKVLASDPNHPEAHAYMGLILAQAGHTDGALMAFDRALTTAPDLAPALWGKGMVLAQTGGDPAEARRLLRKVSGMIPPGPEKDEVEKTITQLGQDEKNKPSNAQASSAAGTQIQGTVDIKPKAKGKIDDQAVLFIIARSSSSVGGPPLAVKRIAKPKFPMPYSLSAQDVMMPGTPFSGKLFVSARLDQDGNPTTKELGNLTGEYKKNPVEVGAKKIDIVLEPLQ
jgi:cytochrome c-type biogenesis protein CcmH